MPTVHTVYVLGTCWNMIFHIFSNGCRSAWICGWNMNSNRAHATYYVVLLEYEFHEYTHVVYYMEDGIQYMERTLLVT